MDNAGRGTPKLQRRPRNSAKATPLSKYYLNADPTNSDISQTIFKTILDAVTSRVVTWLSPSAGGAFGGGGAPAPRLAPEGRDLHLLRGQRRRHRERPRRDEGLRHHRAGPPIDIHLHLLNLVGVSGRFRQYHGCFWRRKDAREVPDASSIRDSDCEVQYSH